MIGKYIPVMEARRLLPYCINCQMRISDDKVEFHQISLHHIIMTAEEANSEFSLELETQQKRRARPKRSVLSNILVSSLPA